MYDGCWGSFIVWKVENLQILLLSFQGPWNSKYLIVIARCITSNLPLTVNMRSSFCSKRESFTLLHTRTHIHKHTDGETIATLSYYFAWTFHLFVFVRTAEMSATSPWRKEAKASGLTSSAEQKRSTSRSSLAAVWQIWAGLWREEIRSWRYFCLVFKWQWFCQLFVWLWFCSLQQVLRIYLSLQLPATWHGISHYGW